MTAAHAAHIHRSTNLYATLEHEVELAASAHARRWPNLRREDLVQEGWAIACECLPRWDRTRAIGPYVGRVLRFRLRNWCYQVTLPVHAPRNNEHKVAHTIKLVPQELGEALADSESEVTQAVVTPDTPFEALARVEMANKVTDAVAKVTTGTPELASMLLGETTPALMEATYGRSKDAWKAKVRRAHTHLRTHLAELAPWAS